MREGRRLYSIAHLELAEDVADVAGHVDGRRWERSDEGPGTSQPALGNGVVPECPAVLGPEEQGHPRSGSVGILVAILGIRSLPGVDCSGDI